MDAHRRRAARETRTGRQGRRVDRAGDRDATVRPVARAARYRARGRVLRVERQRVRHGERPRPRAVPARRADELVTRPRISVFPKCYFDPLCRGEMDYVTWIRSAATLGAEGLEHYDGFFRSLRGTDVDPIISAM